MNDKQSTYDSMMQRVATCDDEDAFKYIFDDLYAPLWLSGKILGSFFSFIVFCIFAL